MKIAIITPYNQEIYGGVEIANKKINYVFNKYNHNVDFITLKTSENLNIKKNRIKNKIFGDVYLTSEAFKKTKKNYDLVICNGEYGFGIDHENCINIFHGSYEGFRKYLKGNISYINYIKMKKKAYIQKLSSKGKYIVTVSKFMENILNEQGINVDKIINLGIDTSHFKPLDLKTIKKYIFVGSYENKGFSKGFDILRKISACGYEIDCVTSEDPGNELGYLGNINNKLLPEIYNEYKMLIFPSRFEALGLVPLEAMSCGLPIVTSNVGIGYELKEYIPEFVVEDWNYKNYIHQIEVINNNYNLYSRKAREFVLNNYSFENFENKLMEMVNEIL